MAAESMPITNPIVLTIAGPNGSGKSTVTNAIPIRGTYVNADDIKASSGCSDLAAAQEAEAIREKLLAIGQDFTFETVLSTDRNLDLLRRAKAAGYYVQVVFLVTASAELNVLRVRMRVSGGGHDVPTESIRRRYQRSLAKLPELRHLADVLEVYDNSGDRPYMIFRKTDNGESVFPLAYWPELAIKQLVGLTPAW
ncbi:MAG: zeta toxin family protein [Bifidobacteriaceae bacterium]|jgi:predicted ABC-type ATPase|nr:zeta toxin family protein [Bifidobacteriaceae bacterium]